MPAISANSVAAVIDLRSSSNSKRRLQFCVCRFVVFGLLLKRRFDFLDLLGSAMEIKMLDLPPTAKGIFCAADGDDLSQTPI